MKFSIVVSFHNERDNIKLIFDEYLRLSKKAEFELICINNGSTDGSAAVFTELFSSNAYPFARLIDISPADEIGYGDGIMHGVRSAKGDIICWSHSDLQTDPGDTLRALAEFKKYPNQKIIVKGNRIKRTPGQVVLSFGMAVIATFLLGVPLFEINAQPKLFSRDFLKELKNPPTDFSLDLYLLYVAKKRGYSIKTIDVLFKKRLHGESKWAFSFKSRWKTIIRTIKYIRALRVQVAKEMA